MIAGYSDERLRDRLAEVNRLIAAHNVEISELTWERQQLQNEDRRRHVKAPATAATEEATNARG